MCEVQVETRYGNIKLTRVAHFNEIQIFAI